MEKRVGILYMVPVKLKGEIAHLPQEEIAFRKAKLYNSLNNEFFRKGLMYLLSVTQTELMPGVRLTMVHTNKFKSSRFGVTLLTPLDRQTASANALLCWVLRRGTRSHPDMQSVSAALDELYGGSIETLVTKKGETQCVGFTANFLDDAYALNGEDILTPAAGLLGELLLHPHTENGVFSAEYVTSERDNLIDRIRAQRNDKRQYALYRLAQEMCRGEAFGVDKLGEEELVRAITPESLWQSYQNLLAAAQVELYYCGSAQPRRVEDALRSAFAELPAGRSRTAPVCQISEHAAEGAPRMVTESLDVTQGKLAIGLRTGGITARDGEFPALLLLNAVFGGTSMSKLFMNVREKLSLCYFASSGLERHKGLMLVSSGIEFEKYEQARDEILAQLESCRRGEITADELEGARRIVITALQTILDTQSRMADHWLGQAVAGLPDGPEEMVRQIERVTPEQLKQVAQKLELDTIYFLKGKEGA